MWILDEEIRHMDFGCVEASQINSTAALSSNITGVCWSTTGSSNSIVNSESFIDSATSRFQTTFMGIEELKRTLTRTLFDREKDCLDGLPTEEDLLTIREDPEEREQMIQFVLEASSSCCWTPLADNFLDIIKSELFKIFHEVYLLPAWHRRESTWMNHALQLAKLHYDRIIDEQHQRSQFMQQKTAVNSTQSVASRTRTSPGYCYNQVPTAATVMMNGIVDHQEYQQNEMRIAAHQRQQQMCIAASQQHRSFGRKDGTICLSPTVFMHSSPMQSCIDYDVPIRPSTEDIYHQLNSRCITTPHGLNNIGVGVEYCPSNGRQNQMNEYFYHPRQIVVPGEMWNRQCIPVDRRSRYRFVCNSDGMPLMQPSSMYSGKTMTKDGDIVIDHMISDCSANGSMSPNQIATTSQCRSGVNSGIYISPSPNSYSPIQTNIQTNQFQQSNNDVYSSPASISPLRINSDCSQMTVASYHQQHPQQLLHQQPHQYQQQRFRLMDSGTMNSMNGGHYNAQFIDQSEYARFRPNCIPDGGNQVMHRGMSPQVQPIMQVGSNQALE
ncbi:hypothetical protein GJ496_008330 [Pomphorhynchus laevis]|nr:hypothetical protein GJ496_008330 [Pomphorhynchus laevis]